MPKNENMKEYVLGSMDVDEERGTSFYCG